MKTQAIILFLISSLIFSCDNDDDIGSPAATSPLAGATLSVSHFDTVTIDLATGNTITSNDLAFEKSIIYENSFIGIFEDRLVRSNTTDLIGDQIWETTFTVDPDFNRSFIGTSLAIHNGILYYTYRLINTTTFEAIHFLEALNLEDGTILWTAWDTIEFRKLTTVGNTLIALQEDGPLSTITSRSVEDGNILNTWEITERISHLIPHVNEVVVMSWSNKIYSIQDDLTINWTFENDGSNVQRGAIVGNQFIFHSRDEFIYALDITSGGINWSQFLPDLFIKDFFSSNGAIWSVTRDLAQNSFNINELNPTNGAIASNFIIPALETANEIEFLDFDEYILIITDQNSDPALTQLFNYTTQNLIWQNEIPINNISILEANVLLQDTRYALSSF